MRLEVGSALFLPACQCDVIRMRVKFTHIFILPNAFGDGSIS
eukprot:COSAG02_NODE_64_length_43111_cov_35.627709_31_plen_42_part_00